MTTRTDQRRNIKRRFYHIITHFGATKSNTKPYNPTQLVRFSFEYVPSAESRDPLLTFFQAMSLSIDEKDPADFDFEQLHSSFFGFANHFPDNFFLLRKTS